MVLKRSATALLVIGCFSILLPEAKCGQSLDPKGTTSGPKGVVVFAARKISKGALIVEEDLRETVVNVRGLEKFGIPIRKSVIARRTRYEIVQGQVILESDLFLNRVKRSHLTKQRKHLSAFVAAKRHIPAGPIIQRSDLLLGSVRTVDSSKWLKDIDQAVGKRAKNVIVREQILTTDVLMHESILPESNTQ